MDRKTETELIVDLRGQSVESLEDFWDAVSEPCGLPDLCGRNVEAWRDAIHTRGISDVIDRHDVVVVHAGKQGIFAATSREGRALRRTFAGRRSRLVIHEMT